MRSLLWFRGKDLRVHDHSALVDACKRSSELTPVFVLSPRYFEGGRAQRAPHRMQYLLAALRDLAQELDVRGSRLLIVRGPAAQAIPRLAARLGVAEVIAIAGSEPDARARDARVAAKLHVPLTLHQGETLTAPGTLLTGAGGMFQVFTPFARAFRAQIDVGAVLRVPTRMPPAPALAPDDSEAQPIPTLAQLGLTENPRLLDGGEASARGRLDAFLQERAERYHDERDRLDLASTSGISADLHFGSLSIRTVFVRAEARLRDRSPEALTRFHNELLWRELAYHWLAQRPALLSEPFRPEFVGFPWHDDSHDHGAALAWQAWADGRTGYPIVDAAARQLLSTGFVHNRARMISASFLCKHLLIHYARGEAHYLKWLVDGDLASNNQGWQWSAGTGCDAQPYFRVFNPITQGQRFDPNGDYVRRYLPELRKLPAKHIHAPWQATDLELRAAGVSLGDNYPHPIVDHGDARTRFLLVAQTYLAARRHAN